ncbi:MAG: hypothetical protein AAB975_02485 [Patescibacteria group bacterium]
MTIILLYAILYHSSAIVSIYPRIRESGMKQEIRQALQIALAGSRKLKIVFKKEAIGGEVAYLLGMMNAGIINLDIRDAMNLSVTNASRKWVPDNNRAVVVMLTDQFDENWFVERMYRALEKIEILN